MLEPAERRPLSDHAKARLQQRLIVSAAIVSDQHLELLQMLLQRAELAGLFTKFTHEELPDAKSLRRDAAHSDQKLVGSRSSRETGCLGVVEAPFRGRHATYQTIGNGVEQIRWQVLEIGDADAPMAAMPFV